MRFARVGAAGSERPFVVVDDAPGDRAFGLEALTPDIDGAFLSGGGIERTGAALRAGELPPVPLDTGPAGARPADAGGRRTAAGRQHRRHDRPPGPAAPAHRAGL